jgi:hypothetical protein
MNVQVNPFAPAFNRVPTYNVVQPYVAQNQMSYNHMAQNQMMHNSGMQQVVHQPTSRVQTNSKSSGVVKSVQDSNKIDFDKLKSLSDTAKNTLIAILILIGLIFLIPNIILLILMIYKQDKGGDKGGTEGSISWITAVLTIIGLAAFYAIIAWAIYLILVSYLEPLTDQLPQIETSLQKVINLLNNIPNQNK